MRVKCACRSKNLCVNYIFAAANNHPIMKTRILILATIFLLLLLSLICLYRYSNFASINHHIHAVTSLAHAITTSVDNRNISLVKELIPIHVQNAHRELDSESVSVGVGDKRLSADNVYIAVKTTFQNHKTRVKLQLETWIPQAPNSVFLITDKLDPELETYCMENNCSVITTSCQQASHDRAALACKTSMAITTYLAYNSIYKWMCIIDDDNYVLVDNLVRELEKYDTSKDWYLGKLSWPHGMPLRRLTLWFTTGGAGTCINRQTVIKLQEYFQPKRFDYESRTVDGVGAADDAALGYLMNYKLNVNVTTAEGFHSHIETLYSFKPESLKNQSILSYGGLQLAPPNTIRTQGVFPSFTEKFDPTRLRSLHCHVYPDSHECKMMMCQTSDYKKREEMMTARVYYQL